MPTPEQIREHLRAMTPEQRQELASHMRVPIRCGGCHYDPDGTIVYIIGGKEMRPAEFRAYKISLGYPPEDC
jgi:hypothetical protein